MVEIYGLYDPDSDELRYIGKANNSAKRLKSHLWDSRTAKRPVCLWIKGLLRDGKLPNMRVLEVVSKTEWEQAERRLISRYRESCRLLNLAEGGNRPSQTKEQRVIAAKASNRRQELSPERHELNRTKMDMGRLYKQRLKTPDINAYTLRLLMKCYAAYRPDLYPSWINLP